MKSMVVRLIFSAISMVAFSMMANAQSKDIVIGEMDTVYSEILGEKRSIWVYRPESDTGKSEHEKRYPVVICWMVTGILFRWWGCCSSSVISMEIQFVRR